MRSVTDGKTMHSMHSYFMRPADIGADVRYEVELLRDGRGYSTRQVRGFQNGKPIYVALANFAAGEPAGRFHCDLVDDIPGPDLLPSSAAYLTDKAPDESTGRMTAAGQDLLARRPQLRHAPRPGTGLCRASRARWSPIRPSG